MTVALNRSAMRTLALCVLAAAVYGCTPSAPAVKADYSDRFAEIRTAVVQLPASPERSEVLRLFDGLEDAIEADSSLAEHAALEAEVSELRNLAAGTEVRTLELGFATAFKDWTGDGQYDGIEVYITPRDRTGSAIKHPGTAEVTLRTSGFLGAVKEIERWQVPAGLLANSWNDTLFPGYVLRLAWQNGEPDVHSAIVHVVFDPIGGDPVSQDIQIEKPIS